jgi:3-dehydroquinate dehydratase I
MLQAVDGLLFTAHHSAMAQALQLMENTPPLVVGSFGTPYDLAATDFASLRSVCDLAEIRLDLLAAAGIAPESSLWSHLQGIPLLFTARRSEEGGALPLTATERMKLLRGALDQAALIDIEAASISEMRELLDGLKQRDIPWIASFHDFEKLPETRVLTDAAAHAKDAGAAAFKCAAMLHSPADLARLAEFQLAGHGIPVATMGMGPLAPVSRLLCAQCGSVLNYGYLGKTPTAPGQWDAAMLKQAITRLTRFEVRS